MLVPGRELITSLPIEERHQIYKLALHYFIHNDSKFLCICLYEAFTLPTKYCHMDLFESMNLFPEFTAHKPEGSEVNKPWFPEELRKERIEIMEACIKATESKKD